MKFHTCLNVILLVSSVIFSVSAQRRPIKPSDEPPETSHHAPRFTNWSTPVNLGPIINSTANDVAPALSRDERSLYFTSTRPGGFGGEDIWVSHRKNRNAAWGTPVNLGPSINSGANERLRYLSPDGHLLLLQSDRPGGFGGSDIWASRRRGVNDNAAWGPPTNLGSTINTNTNELGSAFVADDQRLSKRLYFSSSRSGGVGGADFYFSEITSSGSFASPVNVVEINSAFNDSCLTFSSDGLEVVFTSTRPDPLNAANSNNLWTSTRQNIFDQWSSPVRLDPSINAIGYLSAHPSLSFDGKTLVFTSNRPGGYGGNDLYMTTRRILWKRPLRDDQDEDQR